MYSLTLIRLNSITRVFENTECNTLILLGDLQKELFKHNVDTSQQDDVLALQKGDRITVEIDNGDKLWFYYINRMS